ncbi:hypothetical protein M407DRAFT_246703 [Tulasnella calospora MUT 4182]|uniref:Ubiquitin-like domain-containing protein n=1 Tax=Tulasnella calospora MUT 4182 TaxID=1051891 RepID=A0A0C3L7R1_9AGAM|nr:hypothetical protein M407DRAFT_246703 [Tulasnella calospora MUT 4182]
MSDFKLIVTDKLGRQVTVTANPNTTVDQLKELVADKTGLSGPEIILGKKNTYVIYSNGTATLSNYKIDERTPLFMRQ